MNKGERKELEDMREQLNIIHERLDQMQRTIEKRKNKTELKMGTSTTVTEKLGDEAFDLECAIDELGVAESHVRQALEGRR